MSWTGSTRDGPGPGCMVHHGLTVAQTEGTGARRCAHRSMASCHSGAQKLADGGTTARGEHGELGSGLTGARASVWRPGNGGETAEEGELGDSGTHASGEGEE
jgi:hypothetical protein